MREIDEGRRDGDQDLVGLRRREHGLEERDRLLRTRP